ncbi:uncharacterized protein LOC131435122 [Malaya genurostris]|uniref:uncharacterized protein LOC131435122 n=1 Tax=Malaya genurostris TaxID=325434 RepID=UPI0026F37DC7|nr:uncharacterized protein LOC131435122 [Malaya genurostris]
MPTTQTMDQQKHTIFQYLRQNNYPASLINRLINKIRKKSSSTTTPKTNSQIISSLNENLPANPDIPTQPTIASCSSTDQRNTIYRSIPHINQLTTAISTYLKKDYPFIKLAPKTIHTKNKYLPPIKDPVPTLQQARVIYSIPCNTCDKCYIGMTSNQLKVRLSGHKSNITKYLKLMSDRPGDIDSEIAKLKEKTALVDHVIRYQHNFDLSQTKIIDRSFKSTSLPILEMCHIVNTPNTINHRTDIDGLSTTYAGVLHTVKSTHSKISRSKAQQNDKLPSHHSHSSSVTQISSLNSAPSNHLPTIFESDVR